MMSLFFKISDKEFLSIKNNVFIESGIPELKKKGFQKSPFSTSWFGRNNMSDYTYELCRISSDSHLEYIIVHIPQKDRWIQIHLNVFQLSPTLTDISKLNGIDGLRYHLIPNTNTEMRLRADEYKAPPLIRILFLPKYKISRSLCSYSFNRKVKKITNLIKVDMANIDFFIKRWHELYKPVITNWEGVRIK